MANRTVFSDIFRLSYPHLEKPQEPQKLGDTPKYGIAMMFPQSGVLEKFGNTPSTPNSIFTALEECCQEQWGYSFEQMCAEGMGIAYPPKLKNGNMVFEKDANGNPDPTKISPNSMNMNILTCKNKDPVGCCDPTGQTDIHPRELLAGYWCSAELECSAYESGGNRVIVVKLLNIQLCFHDEVFGNKRVATPASAAFANRAVANTNIAQGSIKPSINPAVPVQNIAPPPPTPAVPVQNIAPPPTPATPVQTIAPPPPPAVPVQTIAPPPPPAVSADPVIMNDGEPTYASMIASGWTDELIIQHNKGKANYLNPAS